MKRTCGRLRRLNATHLSLLAYYPFRYQTLAERKKKISRRSQATITTPLPFSLQQPDVLGRLYEAEIKALREKLSQASVDAVKASEKSASLSAAAAASAFNATKLILARAESLEATRVAVPGSAKKADSLN